MADLIIGNAYANGGGASKGAVYVVYGQSGQGVNLNVSNLASSSRGFEINTATTQGIGYSTANIGDTNGDGLADMLVTAYNTGGGTSQYVVYGRSGYTPLSFDTLNSATGYVVTTPLTRSSGMDIASLGDINGDGYADYAYGDEWSTNYAGGRTFVVFGASNRSGVSVANLTNNTTDGFVINGNNDYTTSALNNTYVGRSIAGVGDVNGDGLADILVTASDGVYTTKAYVVFGKTSGLSVDVSSLTSGSSTAGFMIKGITNQEATTVSAAGDINGDGLSDMIVNSVDAGKAWVVFGKSSGATVNLTDVTARNGGFAINVPGMISNGFNSQKDTIVSAGDLNGDGYDDILIRGSKLYVVYGGSKYATGTVALGTDTSADEYVVGTDGVDTLVGNGGVDNFNAGRGNDTIVLQASDVTNLANTAGALVKASVDGGEGYDTVRLSGGASLDMTTISNVSAVVSDGASRINSIERIDLATDTAGNTLTMASRDVKDMAGFNSIHTGTPSADGATWTNLNGGTALSATTQFHQVVVDGTSADSLVLPFSTGGWGIAGVVSNGANTYNVYQNTASKSQVIVDSRVNVTTSGNSAPVLADTALSLASVADTATAAPTGAVGNLVSALVGGVTDVDTANGKGMAITGVDTTKGSLYYSTNGGTTWTQVTATLSDTNALLLGSDTDNRVYFKPNANLGGTTVSNAFTFRAWDQTAGTEGSLVSVNVNGGSTAFSTSTDVVGQTVKLTGPVNVTAGLVGGYGTANAGDVNGDGIDDIIIGNNGLAGNAGAYIVFGKTSPITSFNLSSLTSGSSTDGFVINNVGAAAVSSAGDLNGDGLADLLIGAPYIGYGATAIGQSAGGAYVVYGKSSGTAVDASSATTLGTNGMYIKSAGSTDNTGFWTTAAGDVNGDGLSDLVVSTTNGKSYVVFGTKNNTAIDLSAIEAGVGGFKLIGDSGTGAGKAISAAGDVNGDGLADILVGGSGAGAGITGGVVYVVFGKTSTSAVTLSTNTNGFQLTNSLGGGDYGLSVAASGDVNGDGLADIILGQDAIGTNGNSLNGRAFIVFGKTSNTTFDVQTLAAGTSSLGFVINGQASSDNLGANVSYAGDINGDGLADLIVSSPSSDITGAADAGKAYVIYGKTNGSVVQISDLVARNGGFVIQGQSVNDNLSLSMVQGGVSNAGDVNGDGYSDLIVSAYNRINGLRANYIIYGSPSYITGTVALGTGTSADEYVVGTNGSDTLTGNGGVDRFSSGAGNDTIVLQASDVTNLANNTVTTVKASVDGGEGFDSISLSGGANLDLTAISNVSAMGVDSTSRISSIERIDMASDTVANMLTITAKDVNDMAGFNSIHLSTASADGKTWTNVTGTALSDTTQFHQMVVDGTSSDSMVLKVETGAWSVAGVVSDGTKQYNVYQNTTTNSQVIVAQDVTVVVQEPTVPTVTITGASVNNTTSVTESFNSAGFATSAANGGTSTATADYVTVTYYDTDGSLTGQQMNVLANNSNVYGFTTGNFLQVGNTNDKNNGNVRLNFTSAIGPFTALSFKYSDLQPSSGNYDGSAVAYLNINGQTINLTANSNPQTVSWSGGAVSSFYIQTTNDQWGIDEMSFTPASQTLTTSNSNTLDSTPLLQGTLSVALSAGQTLDVYDGATRLGAATVSGTSWSYQVGSASAATHNYVAKVVNSSSAVVGMSNTFVLNVKTSPLALDLNGDGVQTTGLAQGAAFDMDANGSAEHVGWVSPQDGWLVRDLNGNGQVDNGTELFGSNTVLADGTKAQDGWAALAAMDSNGDGKVDAQDAAFGQLRVWQDANGNGVSDAGELKSLGDLGIASLNTGHDNRSVEQNGNTLQGFGSFTTTDGATHQVADAWLQSTTESYAVNDSGKLTLLDNHMQLDLSKVTGTQALTEVDLSADASANSVKLNLADLLAQPANSQGLHQLLLTGNANDSAQVNLPDWTDTGTTVTQAGHTYEVFHATTDAHAQLLIDQAMLVNVH